MKSAMQCLMAFVLVLCLVALKTTSAQEATASLRGVVTDPAGASVPAAKVVLASKAKGFSREVSVEKDGSYQFLQVPPGTYDLTVSAPGFKTVVQSPVVLLVATPATVNIKLPISTLAETVTVTGTAAPALNTVDATMGNAFNTNQVETLPFDGRNPAEILSLQPGVVYFSDAGKNLGTPTTASTNTTLVADSRSGSVNGGRSDQANISLDGVDDNDQIFGQAFTGALRATLESTEEFRVTTADANADAGRSSGAQVSLITKSGTNNFHGTLYEYNRTALGRANDWFNKFSEITSGLPNKPAGFVRNTFGGSVGGPIKKDRLFFFFNYEGLRKAEAVEVVRTVPSASLRDGVMIYLCQLGAGGAPVDPRCNNASTVQGRSLTSYKVPAGFFGLSPSQLGSMDPNCLGNGTCATPGPDLAVMNVMQTYPLPNSDAVGDGFNFRGFTFPSPSPEHQNTSILKLDYNLTQNSNHRLFLRGNLQDDRLAEAQQFPGQPPTEADTNGNRGLAAAYTAVLSSNKINNLRYGYIRQSLGFNGANNTQQHVTLSGLDDPQPFTRTTTVIVPVHNLVDDFTWIRGKHTLQFGGNLRVVNNLRDSNEFSFFSAFTTYIWLAGTAIANTGGSLDPGASQFGFPGVDPSFQASYDGPMATLAGLVANISAVFQRNKQGNILPVGTITGRHFRDHELETYLQDSWRLKPNFTLTLGARYSLLQPPYEANGVQVAPTTSMHDVFQTRGIDQKLGIVFDPLITFDLSGQANGRKPYWDWDYKNIAPRIAVAWSPNSSSGWLGALFGGPGKSSLRAGYGIYFDHFGEAMVNTFDRQGSFGLTTQESNPSGVLTVDNVPRFTNLTTIPAALLPLVTKPTSGFPVTPAPATFTLIWGLDDKIKTPYSHVVDFSIQRDLGRGFSAEAAYVGRFGRRLFQEIDLAMPLDLVDPTSHMDYFTAATLLARFAQNNTDINAIPKIPFWQDMFPKAAGQPSTGVLFFGSPCAPGVYPANPTATQAMYDLYACNLHSETVALESADGFGVAAGVCTPACATVKGATHPFQFYMQQFGSLYSWSSIGNSSYNALQLLLRKKVSNGLEFDFNYTFSKSIDVGSNAERINQWEGFGFDDQVVNSWSPNQLKAVSDFDTTHQFNANWIYQIPVGRGKEYGARLNRGLDAIVGGWQIAGLTRWTSGFPISIWNGSHWPTNFGVSGNAVLVGPAPKTGTFFTTNPGDPTPHINIYQNPATAAAAFRFDFPGESGGRNNLRGPGYFGLDMSLQKTWNLGETRSLRFGWDVFNVTNAVRFDGAETINTPPDTITTFGRYINTLTEPRRMQFSLRFAF